jgi:hypothetical protein
MVVPTVGAAIFGIDSALVGQEYRYAIYMAAALMAGWTVLLVWGAFSPVDRRALLLMTAVPVVVGLLCATVYALWSGLIVSAAGTGTLVLQCVIIVLFSVAWLIARRLSRA